MYQRRSLWNGDRAIMLRKGTHMQNKQPTLADVRATNMKNKVFTPAKRKRIDNAFKSLGRYTGNKLDCIPATMPALRGVIDSIEPAAHNIKRPTVFNMRGYIIHAMAQSGLVPGLETYGMPRAADTAAWVKFNLKLKRHLYSAQWTISPFAKYLNARGVNPSDVSDKHVQLFLEYSEATSPRANQDTLVRAIPRNWNALAVKNPELNLRQLTVPPSRIHRLPHALKDFPRSFVNDMDNYKQWASSDDVFDDNARNRKLSDNTISSYTRRVHRCASLLVSSGTPIEAIIGMEVLVTVANFKTIARELLKVEKSTGKRETSQTATILIQIAKGWLRLPNSHCEQLTELKKKLPQPQMVMTEKNKRLVSQFGDPAVFARLAKAPSATWKRVYDPELGNRTRLASAQGALSIAILTSMPIRLNNLTGLEFDKHIFLHPEGTSSLIIPADETKVRRAIEFDIPEELAEMLLEYRDKIVPSVVGWPVQRLFCRTDGAAKGYAQVRTLMQTYFREYVGFHMNPHAFRHLSAKIILDANPEAHVVVQELLGHKSVATATAFYSGLDSRRAGRHHQNLILDALAREQPIPRRRRNTKSGK